MAFSGTQHLFDRGLNNTLSGMEEYYSNQLKRDELKRQKEKEEREEQKRKRSEALKRQAGANAYTSEAAKYGVNTSGSSWKQSINDYVESGDTTSSGLSAFFEGIGERKQTERREDRKLDRRGKIAKAATSERELKEYDLPYGQTLKGKGKHYDAHLERESEQLKSTRDQKHNLRRDKNKAYLTPKYKAMFATPKGGTSGVGGKGTVGQQQIDKEFAKDWNKFSLQGGEADAIKGLEQLKQVSDQLGSGSDTLTGPIVSSLPEFARKRLLPKSQAVQDAVEEVVQRNLRLILGAQFTEREGVRLIARAYNTSLSEEENKMRVDRLMQQMSDAIQAKRQAGAYFNNNNGSMVGYEGPMTWSAGQFLQDIPNKDKTEARAKKEKRARELEIKKYRSQGGTLNLDAINIEGR